MIDGAGAAAMYPPTAASELAERIRANPDAPAPEALNSPDNSKALAKAVGIKDESPAKVPRGPQIGLALPGIACRAADAGIASPVNDYAAGCGAAFDRPAAQQVTPLVGLPGVTSAQAKTRLDAPVHYVTASVTTPINRNSGGTRRRQIPVPLSSLGNAIDRERGVPSHGEPANVGRLPKWARPPLCSANSSLNFTGIGAASSDPCTALSSTTSSLASSLNSSSFPPPAMGVTKFDSNASFKWAPEQVCVQSWHRKLTETYLDYNMVNIVGEGRHGAVFIVQHRKSEKYYACKLLNKGDHNPTTLRSEIQMLRKLDHPNVVRLYETNEDAEAVFLLMELCQGGDLFGRIADEGHLPERTARVFARQMIDALAYCHAMGVVHRDVKPENFLLETEDPDCSTLKLADFGIATSMRFPKWSVLDGPSGLDFDMDGALVNGSQPYMAPELLLRRWESLVKESNKSKDFLGSGDLWSCGVVIYVMLSGDLPYGDSIEAICSGEPPDFSAEVWNQISENAKDLIRKLLNPDMNDRWTAKQALRHGWFANMKPQLWLVQTDEETIQENPSVLARKGLRLLRRWRKQPKFRRIVIAAIAKRLEADHPTMRFAQAFYRVFCSSGDKMRCEPFVQALNAALCDGCPDGMALAHTPEGAESVDAPLLAGRSSNTNFDCASTVQPVIRTGSTESFSTTGTSMSTSFLSPCKGDRSITGLHMRQRVKHVMRRLSRVSEDTPRDTSPLSASQSPIIPGTTECEDLVSLTELRNLVTALDGVKNGVVDYTLLIAAFLSSNVYCDDARIDEIFGQFDVRKRGSVNAEDLQTALSSAVRRNSTSTRCFLDMITDFDVDGDAELNLEEFRGMLKAGAEGMVGDLQTTPPMTGSTKGTATGSDKSEERTVAEDDLPDPPPSVALFAAPEIIDGYPKTS